MKYFCALVVLAIVGCVPSMLEYGRKLPPAPPVYNEPKLGGAGLDERDTSVIRDALVVLPKLMVDSVDLINVSLDKEHFRSDPKKEPAAGHRCKNSENTICLSKYWVTSRLVWHETAHVYERRLSDYYLPDGAYYFKRDWKNVAGNVYGDSYLNGESEGVLTTYGRKSYREDVADWVEECYRYIYEDTDSGVWKNKHLKKDERYRQKLALLFKYGFFNEADYKKLNPLFQ